MYRGLSCYADLVENVRKDMLFKGLLSDYELNRIQPHTNGETFAKKIIERSTMPDCTINGEKLSLLNFPLEAHYDVFISYSHNDEDIAKVLYLLLKKAGVSCFLDSTIWHSADTVLKEIDDRYSLSSNAVPDAKYDYAKRNYSTAHVHAMLSMAMLEAIDRSDLCIFLKSNHSVSLKDGIEKGTLSPWIYEELKYMEKIEQKDPIWLPGLRRKLFDNAHREADAGVKVVYPATGPKEFMNKKDFDIIIGSKERVDCLKAIYKNHDFVENVI